MTSRQFGGWKQVTTALVALNIQDCRIGEIEHALVPVSVSQIFGRISSMDRISPEDSRADPRDH